MNQKQLLTTGKQSQRNFQQKWTTNQAILRRQKSTKIKNCEMKRNKTDENIDIKERAHTKHNR